MSLKIINPVLERAAIQVYNDRDRTDKEQEPIRAS